METFLGRRKSLTIINLFGSNVALILICNNVVFSIVRASCCPHLSTMGDRIDSVMRIRGHGLVMGERLRVGVLLVNPVVVTVVLLLPVTVPLLCGDRFLNILNVARVTTTNLL